MGNAKRAFNGQQTATQPAELQWKGGNSTPIKSRFNCNYPTVDLGLTFSCLSTSASLRCRVKVSCVGSILIYYNASFFGRNGAPTYVDLGKKKKNPFSRSSSVQPSSLAAADEKRLLLTGGIGGKKRSKEGGGQIDGWIYDGSFHGR